MSLALDASITLAWYFDDERSAAADAILDRVTEDGAVSHIDSLAKKYLGQDKYTNAQPGEVRLMCEIEPTSASGMG